MMDGYEFWSHDEQAQRRSRFSFCALVLIAAVAVWAVLS